MRFFIITTFLIMLILEIREIFSDDVIMQKGFYDRDMEPVQEQRRKKPFCNAFTGCGRKRSDDSMPALVDLNPESPLEELNRQISPEAKLWEAIQEAHLEALSRKQKEQRSMMRDVGYPLLNYRKRCGLGNYYC